jgi:hypothetical protein
MTERFTGGPEAVYAQRVLAFIRRHHMCLIALLVALGGTSYAAARPPADSFGARQTQPGAVAYAKLSPAPTMLLGEAAQKARAAWRDPAIASAIGVAGQTIVAQKVVSVPADAPWVDTGLTLTPGEDLWADTRSDGRWSGNPKYFPYSDADGLAVYPGAYRIYSGAQVESLIGFIGGVPPHVPEVSVGASTKPGGAGGITRPGLIAVGDTLLNFAPSTAGRIWLRNNDNTNYYSDVGRQIVKVIIAAGPS